MTEPKSTVKSFDIDKGVIWEAWRQGQGQPGRPGHRRGVHCGVREEPEGEPLQALESDVLGDLHAAAGAGGGDTEDAWARDQDPRRAHRRQTGSRRRSPSCIWSRRWSRHFHPDSYGYRPGRSALDAVGRCRERCWKSDWVIDLDLRSFFDTVDHDLMLKAVAAHTDERWVLLYVERWLKAPLDEGDGHLNERDRGTPQGSAISPAAGQPVPALRVRRVDGAQVRGQPLRTLRRRRCRALPQREPRQARARRRSPSGWRLAGLELHPDKTHIVYCKDADRRRSHEHERFDFLGYTFRPRSAINGRGELFVSFCPGGLQTKPRRRSAERSGAGESTCGAGRPWQTSHGSST